MTALIIGLTVLASGLGLPAQEEAPPRDQPAPRVHTELLVSAPDSGTLTGRASWYDYVRGGAAAGPKLRKMLGKDWRGQRVQVCGKASCIRVTLSDWCQCYKGEKRERIIDLDVRSFAKLAPTSAGIVKVTVRE
jgi:hypothetical protein